MAAKDMKIAANVTNALKHSKTIYFNGGKNMKKAIKWAIVFGVLLLWTLALGINKRMLFEKPLVYNANAMTLQQAPKVTMYDSKTMKVITEKEMEDRLFWEEMKINIVIPSNWRDTDKRVYEVVTIWRRQNLHNDFCSIGKFVSENPEIVEAYPNLDKYQFICQSGGITSFMSHGGGVS